MVRGREPLIAPPAYRALTHAGRSTVRGDDVAAVVGHPDVDRRLDPQALVEERVLNFPMHDRTAFSAVRRVDAAPDAAARRAAGGEDDRRHLAERLSDAVAAAVSDGGAVLLSGGVDSSALAALAARAAPAARGEVFAVTAVGDDGAAGQDRDAARQVCRHLGLRHVEVGLSRGPSRAGSPPLEAWCDLVRRGASPHVPSGGIAAAAAAVAGQAPVLLCGEGADELFAGYWFIYPHPRLYVAGLGRQLAALAQSRAAAAAAAAPGRAAPAAAGGAAPPGGEALSRRIAAWLELPAGELFSSLYRLNIYERLPNLHLRLARAEAAPTAVAFPYTDAAVAEFALAQPPATLVSGGVTKRPLRALVRELLPGGLGDAIAARPKVGLPEAAGSLRATVAAAIADLEGAAWDEHPLRWLFEEPLRMFTADLFLYIFWHRGGRLEPGFDPRHLYAAFDRRRAWEEAAPELVI